MPGKDEHALGERRMLLHGVEELRPFGGDAGVGHVAGDEDEVERVGAMNGFQARKNARETVIAARPAPPTLDAKSVTLADQVNVGKVRDAPRRPAQCCVIAAEIDRLRHQRVGKAPDQRGGGEIHADDHHRIGKHRQDHAADIQQVGGRADPARGRPCGGGDRKRDDARTIATAAELIARQRARVASLASVRSMPSAR